MKIFYALLALASSVAAIPAPAEGGNPDPSSVYIESITYGGTGCPQGSVTPNLSNDRKTFTLLFNAYVASMERNSNPSDARKNCQINILFHVPVGIQFSIVSADFRGYVQLDQKVTAAQKTTYYFQGELVESSAGADFTGPVAKDYIVSDKIPINSMIWSDCRAIRALNANTQIRLQKQQGASPDAKGLITTDSMDGHVHQILALVWRKC